MSFILDALKKSESERQQQSGAEFSSVPSRPADRQSLKWLWILAALLLVNVVVLMGILLRPGAPPAPPVDVVTPANEAAPAGTAASPEPSFEEQVAEAKQRQAEREQATAASPAEPQPVAVTQAPAPQQSSSRRVLTLDELRVTGALQITDLHLDIHVYSDDPAERFVFINMVKHRERSRLDEGPVVNEITPDGVILDYEGMTFLLPRE